MAQIAIKIQAPLLAARSQDYPRGEVDRKKDAMFILGEFQNDW